MNKAMWKSIIVLSCICLGIAVILAAVNFITAPIIEDAAIRAQQGALREVLPDATEFEAVGLTDAVPETVSEIHRDTGGAGYAVVVKAVGYGGKSSPMTVIVGIDMTGKIVRCAVTDASGESAGIGDKVKGEDFLSTFEGKDSSLSGVTTISGATISSSGFLSGVRDAFTAFYAVSGAEQTEEQKLAELIYTALPGSSDKVGFAEVSLTGAPATVTNINRAKNGAGYSVILKSGELTLVVGINSFGQTVGAYDLTKTDRMTDAAVAALVSDAKTAVATELASAASANKTKLKPLFADGATFSRVTDVAGLPANVIDAYSVSGDSAAAYGFVMQTYGYKSVIHIAAAVSPDGKIVELITLSQSESEYFGAAVGETDYTDLYTGETADSVGTNSDLLISGATVSSTAYRSAVTSMFTAYSLVKEAGK